MPYAGAGRSIHDPGKVVLLVVVFAARTEQGRMAGRSIDALVERGDAGGDISICACDMARYSRAKSRMARAGRYMVSNMSHQWIIASGTRLSAQCGRCRRWRWRGPGCSR